jgi:hypothetical protein
LCQVTLRTLDIGFELGLWGFIGGWEMVIKDYNIEILKIYNHVHLTILKNLLWTCMESLFAKNEPLNIHSPLHILLRGLIISRSPKTTCTLFFTIILNMNFLHIQVRCTKKFVKVVVTITHTQVVSTSV